MNVERLMGFAASGAMLGIAAAEPWWEDPGLLVDEPEARYVQQFQLGAYAHFQAAAVSGEAGGREFWYGVGSDWRRARLALDARFLRALGISTDLNMVDDEGEAGGGVEFDYISIFSGWAELSFDEWWEIPGVDGFSIAYGKRKLIELNEEVNTSINRILTVERSSLAAQVAPFRGGTTSTGAWVNAERAGNEFVLGLFTTEVSNEFADWDQGTIALASWSRDFADEWSMDEATLALSGGWQDVESGEKRYTMWDWIVTPWLRLEKDCWGFRWSGAIGDNGGGRSTDGAYYGMVVMPSYWLWKDKLRAVLRYTIEGSEAPGGVRLTSRYAREAGLPANEGIPSLAAGAGDVHHSLYGGLSWRIVPGTWTMLAGVEWQRLESREVEIYEGVTGWFATRVIF